MSASYKFSSSVFYPLGFATLLGIALIALGESIVRLSGLPQPYTALFTYDEILGYRYVANKTVDFAIGSTRYRVEFDAEGVLDREGSRPEESVILGDGVVAGLELPPPQRLAAQIAAGSGRGAVNLSVPGYGPLQQVLLFERWLERHPAPSQVIIIHNLSNDLIDNIPEWEGVSGLPGVRFVGNDVQLILPELPHWLYRFTAGLARRSRIYGWYQRKQARASSETLPLQQKWLYMEVAPPELRLGLDVLSWCSARLHTIAKEKGISVLIVFWTDWGLLEGSDPINDQRRAVERVEKALGHEGIKLQQIKPERENFALWNRHWLTSGTRHANHRATSILAQLIARQLENH